MKMYNFCLLLFVSYVGAAIIPEELPSLLSVAYSNIPPIKKGTDSRVGFGFSLGNHADFQVLFELGPQVDTNPIGQAYPSSLKRQATNKVEKVANRQKPSNNDGNKYLSNWSQSHKQMKPVKTFEPLPIPKDSPNPGIVNLQEMIANLDTSDGTIKQPVPSNMPRVVVNQLKQLYGGKVEAVASVEPPRFVPKGTANTRTRVKTEDRKKPSVGPSFERLAEFNVDEDRAEELRKRKVTADLSDVNLDDE